MSQSSPSHSETREQTVEQTPTDDNGATDTTQTIIEEAVTIPLNIILASQSPRRRELLEKAGVKFHVQLPSTEVDESLEPDDLRDPAEAVKNSRNVKRVQLCKIYWRLILSAWEL